jgi:hypothetical protein
VLNRALQFPCRKQQLQVIFVIKPWLTSSFTSPFETAHEVFKLYDPTHPWHVQFAVHSIPCRYPLLLVATYGTGDLTGKLLPLWRPSRPQATVMALAVVRLLLFLALFSVALLLQAGPYVFFPAVLLMALSAW